MLPMLRSASIGITSQCVTAERPEQAGVGESESAQAQADNGSTAGMRGRDRVLQFVVDRCED
ncbi:hypothetical protein [Rhodococcus oxybenzonivorans]|uniref:hypothetical protein n=1 Tax=Rhodococcus oxybenzonivorans TaxID=1990687 RepID=UPI0030027D78